MPRFLGLLITAALVIGSTACAASVRRISDLQHNPARYQDRSVTVNGVVTSSWGMPLLPFRFYRVGDESGEVTVLSRSGSRVPVTGSRVSVKGRVEEVAVLGGRPIGLHLEEEKLSVKGR